MFTVIVAIVLLISVLVTLIGNTSDASIDDYVYYNGHRYHRRR